MKGKPVWQLTIIDARDYGLLFRQVYPTEQAAQARTIDWVRQVAQVPNL